MAGLGSARALLALAVLTLIWGYTWVVAKQALDFAGPFAMAAWRAVAGTVVLFVALALMRRPLGLVAPLKTAIVGLFQTGAFIALSTWALVDVGAGRTAVLIFTMPIWTLLLAWAILGERIRGAQWWAAASTLSGLALIIQPWNLHASLQAKVLAILAAMAWALSIILVKRWRKQLAADVLSLTAWQMAFGSALLVAVALAVPEKPTQWSPHFIALLAWMALGATALGWLLWLHVLERLPAWQASLSVLGIPVVAILSSRLQLDERVDGLEAAGMLLIGAGLVLISFLNWRSQRRIGSGA